MTENLKKYIVEFIGTFFLMFTIGCASFIAGANVIAPIAIGFILMVMVYAGGPISGGHYNPAVSLAAAIRGALPWKLVLPYWVFQLLGASVAAILVEIMLPNDFSIQMANFDCRNVIIAEFLFTFALCYVVLMTATLPKAEGNSYFGFAIGATVTAGAFVVGAISLAAFNPAVVLGVSLLGVASICTIWTTIIVNLVAAIVAGLTFKLVTK